MLFAISVLENKPDSNLDPTFGRAGAFVIVDSDSGKITETINNPNVNAAGGAGYATAQLLANKGVKAVITGSLGPNAYNVLNTAGIKAYYNSGYSSVDQVAKDFLAGALKPIEQSLGRGRRHSGNF